MGAWNYFIPGLTRAFILKEPHTVRGGLALLFWGGVIALKGPVGRGQALNGCGHLEIFQNYNGARVAIAT